LFQPRGDNDDTGMRVLMLQRDPKDERTGVFTSGIVSVGEGHKIALYFTGGRHAGANLAEVLKKRSAELPSPIQMCDALSRNVPKLLRVWRSCWLTALRMVAGNSWRWRITSPANAVMCWSCWGRCMATTPKRVSTA
jgi:hypothetical protein